MALWSQEGVGIKIIFTWSAISFIATIPKWEYRTLFALLETKGNNSGFKLTFKSESTYLLCLSILICIPQDWRVTIFRAALLCGQESLVVLGRVDSLPGLLLILKYGILMFSLGQLKPFCVLAFVRFLLEFLQFDLSLSLFEDLRQHQCTLSIQDTEIYYGFSQINYYSYLAFMTASVYDTFIMTNNFIGIG